MKASNVKTKVVKNAILKKVFVLCDIRTSQFIHVCIYLMDGYTQFFHERVRNLTDKFVT